MNYELAKELKDAGFPQDGKGLYAGNIGPVNLESVSPGEVVGFAHEDFSYVPTLSELVDACKPIKADDFGLVVSLDGWLAYYNYIGYFEHHNKFLFENDTYNVKAEGFGSTPEEAVARLWLALNKK